MHEDSIKATAQKALSLLDLTDLTDDCDAAAIEKLCAQAQTRFGSVCMNVGFAEGE